MQCLFAFRFSVAGFRVSGLGCSVQGFRVSGSWLRVDHSGGRAGLMCSGACYTTDPRSRSCTDRYRSQFKNNFFAEM